MEIPGSPFVLVNCYGPNTESSQVKHFKEILAQIGNLEFDQDSQFILTGDWNLIFDTFLDSLGGKPQLNKRSIFHLKIMMEDLELVGGLESPLLDNSHGGGKLFSKCVILTFLNLKHTLV